MSTTRIESVHARQIFDSRGRPTIEVEVTFAGGARGRAAAPAGASTGRHEARELRDGDPAAYGGRGVSKAVAQTNGEIAACLAGRDGAEQAAIDARLREADGSQNLARLGANAVLATSLATCRAAAHARRLPLYRYLAELSQTAQPSLPLPMVNILSGGAHAGRSMDVQDFLVVPLGAADYAQALRMVLEVREAAGTLLAERGLSTLLADEGGLSPGFARAEQALELMVEAIRRARYEPGVDLAIAIDVAASELFQDGRYQLRREGRELSREEMIATMQDWLRRYPVISIEDALHQDDWDGWQELTARAGHAQLVGDDLFATQTQRIERGFLGAAANAVLIKPNQNGTLSGTLQALATARAYGYATIVSARSGETEDDFIADLAVGTDAGQIKVGSVRSAERMSKYNRLLRIAEDGVALCARKPCARRTSAAA